MQPYQIIQPTGSDVADEWTRMGVVAHTRGDLPKAQESYGHALRINPRCYEAIHNLAIAYAQSKMFNDALLTMERAILTYDKNSALFMNQALIAHEADRIDEALAAAKRAMEIDPDNPQINWALAIVYASAGLSELCIPLYEKVIGKDPKHPAAGPNTCFVQTLTSATPKDLLAKRRAWYEANRFTGDKHPHPNVKDPDKKLRVGYVGGDFKSHSAAFIFSRVLMHHTPAVEMYLYSSLPVDPVADLRTKMLQDASQGRWRDIAAADDGAVEAQIRMDQIDILVDLAGHTNGGRLPLFTRKPAPVQVTAWGFAHGTGVPEIDYFFADPIAVPPEEREYFAEKIYDLPCIVTMEAPKEYGLNPPTRTPMSASGYPTFGVHARYEKMSDECLRTYAEILRKIPDSRMMFKDHAFKRPYSIRRVMSFMDGIEPERLLFATATAHNEHMSAYQQCDVCLDPWPHGGGVVALEQLYMGVPLITKYGTQPSGRSGASVLTQIGYPEWIAKTPEEFIEKAAAIVDSAKDLQKIRAGLRDKLLNSPVVKDYDVAVEAAYRAIWKEYCSK